MSPDLAASARQHASDRDDADHTPRPLGPLDGLADRAALRQIADWLERIAEPMPPSTTVMILCEAQSLAIVTAMLRAIALTRPGTPPAPPDPTTRWTPTED